MPFKLAAIVQKVNSIPNLTNCRILQEFVSYMNDRDLSENHQINNLKVMIPFANFIGPDVSFCQIKTKEQILQFLDSKKRNSEEDPEKNGSQLGMVISIEQNCSSGGFTIVPLSV